MGLPENRVCSNSEDVNAGGAEDQTCLIGSDKIPTLVIDDMVICTLVASQLAEATEQAEK